MTSIDGYRRRRAAAIFEEGEQATDANQCEKRRLLGGSRKLASQVDVQRKVALAEYVSLRKIVLQHLEDLLNAQKDGKASLEEDIHNLIFPQKSDTESDPGTAHQLWIVDERLESHKYLASDKAMDGSRGDRPDLLIALDKPGAFASDPFSKSKGYERVVLVEFKRALEDLATTATDDLPHQADDEICPADNRRQSPPSRL